MQQLSRSEIQKQSIQPNASSSLSQQKSSSGKKCVTINSFNDTPLINLARTNTNPINVNKTTGVLSMSKISLNCDRVHSTITTTTTKNTTTNTITTTTSTKSKSLCEPSPSQSQQKCNNCIHLTSDNLFAQSMMDDNKINKLQLFTSPQSSRSCSSNSSSNSKCMDLSSSPNLDKINCSTHINKDDAEQSTSNAFTEFGAIENYDERIVVVTPLINIDAAVGMIALSKSETNLFERNVIHGFCNNTNISAFASSKQPNKLAIFSNVASLNDLHETDDSFSNTNHRQMNDLSKNQQLNTLSNDEIHIESNRQFKSSYGNGEK